LLLGSFFLLLFSSSLRSYSIVALFLQQLECIQSFFHGEEAAVEEVEDVAVVVAVVVVVGAVRTRTRQQAERRSARRTEAED
jgi:hypothetical protein